MLVLILLPSFNPPLHANIFFFNPPLSLIQQKIQEHSCLCCGRTTSRKTCRNMRPQEEPKKVSNGSLAKKEKVVRYRECRKNHAANIGGYALDGCREFMASGEEGTSAALRCAACNCHRSFHKREVEASVAESDTCDCSSDSTTRN